MIIICYKFNSWQSSDSIPYILPMHEQKEDKVKVRLDQRSQIKVKLMEEIYDPKPILVNSIEYNCWLCT